jgi:predicted AlkP superfamily pyrophosphatase or phosphodiesterase
VGTGNGAGIIAFGKECTILRRFARAAGAAALLALLAGVLSCGTPPAGKRRVFLIGIDGATWDRIDPLLAEDRLPNLAALIDEGTRAPLASLTPCRSPALWTTVATGKSFEKHGINDFTVVETKYRPMRGTGKKKSEKSKTKGKKVTRTSRVMHMTSNLRKTKALWNIVGDQGGRSAFVGWWVTWPAEEVEGYMVSSHIPLSQTGTPDKPTKGTLHENVGNQTWPADLFDKLRPGIVSAEDVVREDMLPFMDVLPGEMEMDLVKGFQWAWAADETYRNAAVHLLETDPDLDLVAVYFNGVDVVGHRYWKYFEPAAYPPFPPEEIPRYGQVIERYYEYTDGLLGEVLRYRRPGDTIIIVSDHGFHAHGHKDGPDGILIAAGDRIRPGSSPEKKTQLADITPTVLALLGYPVGLDMDGRVLEELFTSAWKRDRPRDTVETHDTEEWKEQEAIPSDADEELLRRLRALGYIQ